MGTIPSQPATSGSEQPHRVLDAKGKARLQRAVKEFESVMVGYMLKSMRSSVPKEEMFGESLGGDMMEGMFDGELARYVSRGSDLGLGEMLYKEITGEELPTVRPPSTGANKPAAPTIRRSPVTVHPPSSGSTGTPVVTPRATAVIAPITTAPETSIATPRVPVTFGGVPPSVPSIVHPPFTPPVQSGVQPEAGQVRPGTVPTPVEKQPVAPLLGEQKQETIAPAIGNVTAPPDTIRRRLDALDPIIRSAADTTGVNASLLKAVIATESGGRTEARSTRNAKGLMQLIDSTASAMGVRNVWDPLQNVQGGAKYLGQMMDRFGGNIEHALASYNAGPGAVEKHKGVPPYRETQQYVGKVLEYLRYFEQQETGSDE